MWGQQIGSLEKDVGQYGGDARGRGDRLRLRLHPARGLIEKIGGLSDDFESYFEDTDYCLRARGAGSRRSSAAASPSSTTSTARRAATTGDSMRIFQASRAMFRKKWEARSRPATRASSSGSRS